jgi:hypothetical protein
MDFFEEHVKRMYQHKNQIEIQRLIELLNLEKETITLLSEYQELIYRTESIMENDKSYSAKYEQYCKNLKELKETLNEIYTQKMYITNDTNN